MSVRRSHSDLLDSPPPYKKKHIRRLLAEFSEDLQDYRIRDVLFDFAMRCATIPGCIVKMAEAIKAAKFSQHVEDARCDLNNLDWEPRGKLRGSQLHFVIGHEIKDRILRTVDEDFNVHRDMCYEKKYNAVTALPGAEDLVQRHVENVQKDNGNRGPTCAGGDGCGNATVQSEKAYGEPTSMAVGSRRDDDGLLLTAKSGCESVIRS